MKRKVQYASNLDITSLIIRIKNLHAGMEDYDYIKHNRIINKYILYHERVKYLKIPDNVTDEFFKKKQRVMSHIYNTVIRLSEQTKIDTRSFNHFGSIVMQMINGIIHKPQFSGYTYRDDFYSDACYKIIKYIDNFDHNIISRTTGKKVSAFAYVTQIIHRSIIFIINSKKHDLEAFNKYALLHLTDTKLKNVVLHTAKINTTACKTVRTLYLSGADEYKSTECHDCKVKLAKTVDIANYADFFKALKEKNCEFIGRF